MIDSKHTPSPVIDAAVVSHIARLAKLAPDEAEQICLQRELRAIIGYFQRLDRLDTQDVLPAYHPHQLENQMRQDEVLPPEERDSLLALALRQQDDCLVAPRTVE
jgi:aspartyl-tRNA(Asn)/glutamyl-tRNA(Gln) amidotransferase subunit C